jgi:RNA-directed DNA polymerase
MEDRYTEAIIPKKDGTNRYVYNPHYLIRRIQRKINSRIFNPIVKIGKHSGVIKWPSYIFGCIPTQYQESREHELLVDPRDYIACAKVHCLSKSILKIDVSNFFENIHKDIVFEIFNQLLDYEEPVANALADICCKGNHLVQGGLPSSYLACLALWDLEPHIVKRLDKKGLKYTRLIDDITVSSKKHDFQFDHVKDLIVSMLHSKDLPVNKNKTEVTYVSTKPMIVHGLRVNYKEPRLPSDEVSRIRANVHNVEKLAQERHYRTIHPYRKDFNRCMGRVNKLKRLGHNAHIPLLRRLQLILPLPSKLDITRCDKMICRLEHDFENGKHDTFWYWRRYHRASQRLVVLKRTFIHKALEFRLRLKNVKPTF